MNLRTDIAPDLNNASLIAFASLAKAVHQEKLTLALGAGVSASSGLPPWVGLLRRIAGTYLTHWEFENSRGKASNSLPPKDLSISFWNEYHWSDATKKIATEFVKHEDALQLAQMIKARIRPTDWMYLVRKSLYGDSPLPAPSELLSEIAGMCSIDIGKTEILSYNYDNLVEVALQQLGIRSNGIWQSTKHRRLGTVSVYYPHGYLKYGGGPNVPIVLGEDDYSEYSIDQLGWKNSVQLRQFSSTTCLFIGFSLTDPQVRRLLWVAKRSGGTHHYALLPSAAIKEDKTEMLESLFDAQLRDINVNVIRYCAGVDGKDHSRLPQLIKLLRDARNNPSLLWAR
jgi:hypothetical protein